MKILAFTISSFLSTAAFASNQQYRIETQIFIDGTLVSSPRIVTLAHEPAEISQVSQDAHQEMRMKVVASDISNEKIKDGILMKFDLTYVSGGKTIHAAPEILAKAGSEATIEIGRKKDQPEVKMNVTAIRE